MNNIKHLYISSSAFNKEDAKIETKFIGLTNNPSELICHMIMLLRANNVNNLRFRIVYSFDRIYMIVYDNTKTQKESNYSIKCFRKYGEKRNKYKYKYIYGDSLLFRVDWKDKVYKIIDMDKTDMDIISLCGDFEFYNNVFCPRVRKCLSISDGMFKTAFITKDMKIEIGGRVYDQDISL